MKTNPLKRKLPPGFWIIATFALFIASLFLFTERFLWKFQSEMGATSEGRYAALDDIHNERFQYLILDPNGHFNFTGELRDEYYKVRERAAKFLGMMGPQARDAVPPLIVATQDDYAEVRARAVWALGRIGPSDHSEEATRALELVRERLDQKTQELISRALREVSARNVEPREVVPK